MGVIISKSVRAWILFCLCAIALAAVYLQRFTYQNRIGHGVNSWRSSTSHPKMFRETFNPSSVSDYPIGADNLTDKDRYFIYRCDESTMSLCGGWADRIKGIINGYMIANLTGRTFKAEMLLASCDFHKFIVPNQIDWYLPKSLHKTVRPGSDVARLDVINNNGFINGINDNFLAMSWKRAKYVYYKGNRERAQRFQSSPRYRKQLSWMANLTYDQINNALYRRLFKPSPYLQNKLNSFLKTYLVPYNKLVCAHIRLGRNPTIPNDNSRRHQDKYLPNVWKFLQTFAEENNTRIFFMSDSEELISQVRNMSFGNEVFFSPGQIVHLDLSRRISAKEKCDGLEKVIFEQLVLMHCDVLMISKSGISRFAASIRGTDAGLYCFLTSGPVVPCKRSEILQTYGYDFRPRIY